MAPAILQTLTLRVIYPVLFLAATIIRPSIMSLLYGLLLLVSPHVPSISRRNTPGATRWFLLVSLVVTLCTFLAQVSFQIAYAAKTRYDTHFLPNCGENTNILRQLGLEKVFISGADVRTLDKVRVLSPEILTFFASILSYVICVVLNKPASPTAATAAGLAEVPINSDEHPPEAPVSPKANGGQPSTENEAGPAEIKAEDGGGEGLTLIDKLVLLLVRFSEIIGILLLLIVATIYPCMLSAVYFITYLAIMTWWSAHRTFSTSCLNRIRVFLLVYSSAHMIIIYLYQVPFLLRTEVPARNLTARVIGLTPLVDVNCSETSALHVHPVPKEMWPTYLNPLLLLVFYCYSAMLLRYIPQASRANAAGYKQAKQGSPASSPNKASAIVAGLFSTGDETSSVHEELLSDSDDEIFNNNTANTTDVAAGDIPLSEQSAVVADVPASAEEEVRRRREQRMFPRMFSIGTVPINKQESRRIGAIFGFLVKHSYVLSLIAMMAWAITYHSWLSFVFLAIAGLIWMVPDSRKACYILSPFIVFYAEVLLCIQFIYGLNLNEDELPADQPPILKQIGLIRTFNNPAFIPCLVKSLYALPFFLTLRLFLRDRLRSQQSDVSQAAKDAPRYGTFPKSASLESIGFDAKYVKFVFTKYWIYLCGLIVLLVAIRAPVTAYNVIYMLFFIILLTVLQISYRLWRMMLLGFWTVVTVFSIIVLMVVYTYQFPGVPEWWANTTEHRINFTSLGFESYEGSDSVQLFGKLLTPISYLIIVIMQLKFFHRPFMRLTEIRSRNAPPDAATTDQPTLSISKSPLWLKTYKRWHRFVDILWLFAEIHFSKLIALIFLLAAVNEVSFVGFPLVVISVVLLGFRCCYRMTVIIGCIYTSVVVLAKMLFQVVPPEVLEYVHVNKTEGDVTCEWTVNGSQPLVLPPKESWAGFVLVHDIGAYLKWYVAIFVVIGLEAVVMLRQRHQRRRLGLPSQAHPVIFAKISHREADDGIVPCLQFLANYGLYKFGLEISFTVTVITIATRMDAVAALYGVLLLCLVFQPRPVLARIWPVYVFILAVLLPLQYASCLGFPPCFFDYPWSWELQPELQQWLFMPNYEDVYRPNVYFLVADFFQFLFACCQMYAFSIEKSFPSGSGNFAGGDNRELDAASLEEVNPEDPLPSEPGSKGISDFITYRKSYLDWIKDFVFEYMHWITLLVIFLAGVASISLFSLGYLLVCFLFLWRGNDMFTNPIMSVIKSWKGILAYNVLVILLKVFLQLLGCAFAARVVSTDLCWVRQLFSIVCVHGTIPADPPCQVHQEDARISVDVAVFAFLILQLRIFRSRYFQHVVREFRAQKQLSSCGAELINQIIQDEIEVQKREEATVRAGMQSKMEQLQAARKKAIADSGIDVAEPTNYFEGRYSGDYYMFEHDSSPQLDDMEIKSTPVVPEVDANVRRDTGTPTDPLKVIVDAIHDTDEAVDTGDVRIEIEEPKPGTSVDVDGEEQDEEGLPKKATAVLGKAARVFERLLNAIASYFNDWSRNYRYVAFVLDGQKKQLKAQIRAEMASLETTTTLMAETTAAADESSTPSTPRKRPSTTRQPSRPKRLAKIELSKLHDDVEQFSAKHSFVMRFFIAWYYLIVSRTELLCYFLIVVNMMGNASILSLPLPLMAFFWGALSAPRPSKTFWITLITYTEAVIVVKALGQFGFFGNKSAAPNVNDKPFDSGRILGVIKEEYYASYDIALLMVLFYHRYALRALGLWRDASYGREGSIIEEDPKRSVDSQAKHELALKRRTSTSQSLQEHASKDKALVTTEGRKASVTPSHSSDSQDKKQSGIMAYFACCRDFWPSLMNPQWYKMDLYVAMFICDFVCFLILIFFYKDFAISHGPSADVLGIIQENRVPLPFLLMLLAQFVLIVIGRALYLRRTQLGQIIFHFFLVVLIHIWMFFIVPYITERLIVKNQPAQFWYFIKCIYFVLSAWQIRSGYPSKLYGNAYSSKSYTMLNYVFFKIFMAIPFLFELRTLMDWIWTDTALTLFDFFKVEDIYSYIYGIKCNRNYELAYPVPIGQKRNLIAKYGMGLSILVLIILILWLPLLLFTLLNTIGQRRLPESAKATFEIDGYPALFEMTAQGPPFLEPTNSGKYSRIKALFNNSKSALAVFDQYSDADVQEVLWPGASSQRWDISYPIRKTLVDQLNNESIRIGWTFSWEFTRAASGTVSKNFMSGSRSADFTPEERKGLVAALQSKHDPSTGTNWVVIHNVYPVFLQVPPQGEVTHLKALEYPFLTEFDKGDYTKTFLNVSMSLEVTNETERQLYGDQEWWDLNMYNPPYYVVKKSTSSLHNLRLYAFVDKVFPQGLNVLVGNGILGVYVVVVLAAGRFLRAMVTGSVSNIIILDLPDVDNILRLCQYLYLVREAADFTLEVLLFAKLLFLYRSPKTLIEWTKLTKHKSD